MSPKKEPYLEYFATECDEFHDMGAYEKSTDVNQIAAVYEKYRENPETAYLGCSMGIIYRDPEDSYYDDAEFAILHWYGKGLRKFMKHCRTISIYRCGMFEKQCILRR